MLPSLEVARIAPLHPACLTGVLRVLEGDEHGCIVFAAPRCDDFGAPLPALAGEVALRGAVVDIGSLGKPDAHEREERCEGRNCGHVERPD